LEQITGAPPVAQALVAAGPLPPALLDRVKGLNPPAASASGKTGLVAPGLSAKLAYATQTSGGITTPRSSKAYMFDSVAEGDDGPFRTAAIDQGYTLVRFKIGGHAYKLGQNSTSNFFSMARNGGAGLLYISAHGTSDLILFDDNKGTHYLTRQEIRSHWLDVGGVTMVAACQAFSLNDAFAGGDYIGVPFAFADATGALALSNEFWTRLDGTLDNGQKRTVADAYLAAGKALSFPGAGAPIATTTLTVSPDPSGTTLHLADTSGAEVGQLVFGFNDVNGVDNPSDPGYDRSHDTTNINFYLATGEITAVDAQAKSITIKRRLGSFANVTGSIQFGDILELRKAAAYAHRGDGQRVLAPSVVGQPSGGPAPLDTRTDETVAFDAAMKTNVAPNSLIVASGICKPELISGSAKWNQDGTLTFGFKAHKKGKATFVLLATAAISADNGLPIDGNTSPPGKNAVGPAGDDYTWDVECGTDLVSYKTQPASADYFSCDHVTGDCTIGVPVSAGSILRISPTIYYVEGASCDFDIVWDTQLAGVPLQSVHFSGTSVTPSNVDFGTIKPGTVSLLGRMNRKICNAYAFNITLTVTTNCDGGGVHVPQGQPPVCPGSRVGQIGSQYG
jgi:hypothetical protein